MASKIKQKIAKNFYNAVQNQIQTAHFEELFGCFNLIKEDNKVIWRVCLPFKPDADPDADTITNAQNDLKKTEFIKNVKYMGLMKNKPIDVELEVSHLIKDVLDSNPVQLNYKVPPKKIIVEYSSPNIAKPFHVGHLRSTLIGNSIANLKKKLGNDVVRMNYLGDWGTQFGLIQVGLEQDNYSNEDLQQNPIKLLYEAYVKGNRKAERDQQVYDKAREIFVKLESGDPEMINNWSLYRKWTIKELSSLYERLGVVFDEYSWESEYRRMEANNILKMVEEKGILSIDAKGRQIATVGETEIPLIKSDNTTLYLLRDLLAILDRKSKHNFDEMYYVVENGQADHFKNLFNLCNELQICENRKVEHVKFGRIHNMSTRKGKVVFLKDILEEARDRAYEKQATAKNTKVSLETKEISDLIGVSAVIVNDLKYSRRKDYDFSWENILQMSGATGVHLQYCHCRLCSLEDNSGAKAASDCDPDALLEPEAVELVLQIARFEEALLKTNQVLEPCTFLNYLFGLSKTINKALKELSVKNSDEHVASQRQLLFNKSKEVLGEGLRLIGVKPLTRM